MVAEMGEVGLRRRGYGPGAGAWLRARGRGRARREERLGVRGGDARRFDRAERLGDVQRPPAADVAQMRGVGASLGTRSWC